MIGPPVWVPDTLNHASTAASRLFFTVPLGNSMCEEVPLNDVAVSAFPAIAPGAPTVVLLCVPASLPRLIEISLAAPVGSFSPRRQYDSGLESSTALR
jgi:hypothetical protein